LGSFHVRLRVIKISRRPRGAAALSQRETSAHAFA
jgi:hypothetical protein